MSTNAGLRYPVTETSHAFKYSFKSESDIFSKLLSSEAICMLGCNFASFALLTSSFKNETAKIIDKHKLLLCKSNNMRLLFVRLFQSMQHMLPPPYPSVNLEKGGLKMSLLKPNLKLNLKPVMAAMWILSFQRRGTLRRTDCR